MSILGRRHGPKANSKVMVRCDFCSRSSAKVKKLFAGPKGTHICNGCVDVCEEIILDTKERPEVKSSAAAGDVSLRCSFCDKCQDEVDQLIAGPTVYICNECVAAFRDGSVKV